MAEFLRFVFLLSGQEHPTRGADPVSHRSPRLHLDSCEAVARRGWETRVPSRWHLELIAHVSSHGAWLLQSLARLASHARTRSDGVFSHSFHDCWGFCWCFSSPTGASFWLFYSCTSSNRSLEALQIAPVLFATT